MQHALTLAKLQNLVHELDSSVACGRDADKAVGAVNRGSYYCDARSLRACCRSDSDQVVECMDGSVNSKPTPCRSYADQVVNRARRNVHVFSSMWPEEGCCHVRSRRTNRPATEIRPIRYRKLSSYEESIELQVFDIRRGRIAAA